MRIEFLLAFEFHHFVFSLLFSIAKTFHQPWMRNIEKEQDEKDTVGYLTSWIYSQKEPEEKFPSKIYLYFLQWHFRYPTLILCCGITPGSKQRKRGEKNDGKLVYEIKWKYNRGWFNKKSGWGGKSKDGEELTKPFSKGNELGKVIYLPETIPNDHRKSWKLSGEV